MANGGSTIELTGGKLLVELTQKKIEEILPIGEIENVSEGIISIAKWAVPHWDWAESVKIGAVQVNRPTVEFIIGRLVELFPNNKQEVMNMWLNYGLSVNTDIPNWSCLIDFCRIYYKEDLVYLWKEKEI